MYRYGWLSHGHELSTPGLSAKEMQGWPVYDHEPSHWLSSAITDGMAPCVDEAMAGVERSIPAHVRPSGEVDEACRGTLPLYRELVAAVKRLALGAVAEPLP